MLSRLDSPVRTLVSLGTAPDLPEAVRGSTGRLYEPFAWYDPSTPCWRTWQRCLVEGWEQFSGTWPRSGMTRSGIAYRSADLAPPISGTGFGLLPTPTVGGGGQSLPEGTTPTGMTPEGRKQTVCLERYLSQIVNGIWPLPFLPTITVNDEGNITAPNSQFDRKSPGLPVRLAMTAGTRLGHASLRTFAEWMMGFEVGWTRLDSTRSATRSRQQSPNSSATQS